MEALNDYEFLKNDDLDTFFKIIKKLIIEYVDKAFKQGGSKIRKYIIETYPEHIKPDYFIYVAEKSDLEMLKLLNENYKGDELINWRDLWFYFTDNTDDDLLINEFEFFLESILGKDWAGKEKKMIN